MIKAKDAVSMKTEFYIADRIAAQKDCCNIEALLTEHPRQSIIGEECRATIKAGGYAVLDFGEELQGGVAITIHRAVPPGSKMRIVFGESFSEAMSSIGEKNATNDHSIRDMTVELVSWQHFNVGATGFRFVKLEALDSDVCLVGAQAFCSYRDYDIKGEFSCDDELLNRIWKTGVRTVQLNMQEYLVEGIKRDRLVWIGDMHPETSTVGCAFGKVKIVEDSLDLIRDNTKPGCWMNGKPSYNMWWLKIQRDWYWEYGDFEYLASQKQYIFKMLESALEYINEDGTHCIDEQFVEWSSRGNPEEKSGIQAMLTLGMSVGVELCEILGNDILAKKCNDAANALKQHVYEYAGNKQIAAMTALAGLTDLNDVCNNVLKVGGANGLSSFWGYYTLQALAKNGDMCVALDIIREYWGGMLKMGATTFWEDFDIRWMENAAGIDDVVPEGKLDIHGDFGKHCYLGFRHSLCHGWASNPTAFMSKYVMGVEILEPGCQKIRIKPNMGNLKWAKCTYPTAYGEMIIEHKVLDGKVETIVNAPEGITVVD